MREDLSKLTFELRLEHASILQKFDQLMNLIRGPAEKLDDSGIYDVVYELKTLLGYHLAKEETRLFPVFKETIDEDDLLETMLEDHRRLGDFMEKLSVEDALKGFPEGFGTALQAHVSKQEKVLFWLAEVRIGRRA